MKHLSLTLLLLAALTGNLSAQNPACDSLFINSVKFDPLIDSFIVLNVTNQSTDIFSYPNWVITSTATGDTIGNETPNFFGIGSESQHALAIYPAALADPTTSVQIDLYSGFGQTLQCTYTHPMVLCPVTPNNCRTMYIELSNFGGAIVDAELDWTLTDGANVMETGTLVLEQNGQQTDLDSVCVAPGNYTVSIPSTQPFGGQLYLDVRADCPSNTWIGGVYQPDSGFAATFDFWANCSAPDSIPNSIADARSTSEVRAYAANGLLRVEHSGGLPINQVQVFGLDGRLIATQRCAGPVCTLNLPALANNLYLVRTAHQGGISQHKVVH